MKQGDRKRLIPDRKNLYLSALPLKDLYGKKVNGKGKLQLSMIIIPDHDCQVFFK